MTDLKLVVQRIGIIIVICLLVLILGAMIGYGIGGGNPFAVFLPQTWGHILGFLR